MEICKNYHEEICFDGRRCPMCEKINEIEKLETELDELQDKYDEVQQECEDLETELKELDK